MQTSLLCGTNDMNMLFSNDIVQEKKFHECSSVCFFFCYSNDYKRVQSSLFIEGLVYVLYMATTELTPQLVEDVAKKWARLDWDNTKIKLDEEVKAIGIRENESQERKIHLLEVSRKYQQETNKEQREPTLSLIKSFQKEVDYLNQRCRVAEGVVIGMCIKFTLIPDPTPYLEQTSSLLRKVERQQNSDEQVELLKRQLAELRDEYADLQNQELTIRQLREQLKQFEIQKENCIQSALNEKEKEVYTKLETLKDEMSSRQEKLIVENKLLNRNVAVIEAKYRDSERLLFETKRQLEEKEVVGEEQLSIISNDLEMALQRANAAELEVQRLMGEMEKVGRSGVAADEKTEDSLLLRTKDRQIRKLVEENKMLSTKLAEERAGSVKHIEELTRELDRHVQLLAHLQAQLQGQDDYDAIKKELRILRCWKFGEDLSTNNDVPYGVTSTATATAEIREVHTEGKLKALDELLVETNRKLQSENAELRMHSQQIEDRLKDVECSHKELGGVVQQQRDLIARLESALLNLHAASPRQQADGVGSEEIVSDADHYSAVKKIVKEVTAEGCEINDVPKNVLSIVTAQRDRLKERVEELESTSHALTEGNKILQSELEKARGDNVKLCGKIKFLQSYKLQDTRQTKVKIGANGVEERYQDDYERYLDPFRKFNMQERQRIYGQLSACDKAALTLSQWIIGSSQSRALFFLYLLLLHLLVFLVLYRFAYAESFQRDFQADCIANFQQHMNQFHPNAEAAHQH